MLVIGSMALVKSGISNRNTIRDLDLIVNLEEFQVLKQSSVDIIDISDTKKVLVTAQGLKIECELAIDNNSASQLLDLTDANTSYVVADKDLCYTLKMSHRFKKNSPHFYKTMEDIKYLRSIGATIPESLKDWYKLREKETYNYGHPKLDVTKEDFFKDDGIPYIYDHDSIHEVVALCGKPAYKFFKPVDKEVLCSKEMFDKCPEYLKLFSVIEESMVLALERSIVPYNYEVDAVKIFKYALMKVCTSITSGWWRDYAWDNHDEALNLFLKLRDYYKFEEIFKEKADNKQVLLFENKTY